ncbi:YjcZ family sporulation protein [Pontibacillus sp. ALD_SL1]|uniref:YjcZ family sporulation protein n=1 Tax=Pontibacillus sp. ALD_SL1 TaxID=2777185 RepID=UPI002738CF1C|nr:YjcZ family sporulation protein [Pontibacillus sp. ALD_SL1]
MYGNVNAPANVNAPSNVAPAYMGPSYGMMPCRNDNTFVLIVVLFILLIIVGACCYYNC